MKVTVFKWIVFTLLSLFVANILPLPAYAEQGTLRNAAFSCDDSEDDLIANEITATRFNDQAIYIGYQQISGNNQDPIVTRFDNGVQIWCRTDYETTNDDNRGVGVYWNGTNDGLYLTFSATGTQGSTNQDFRRFAKNGWLKSYTDGSINGGGGPKVVILAKANPADGEIEAATFLTAVTSTNKTNSMLATKLTLVNDQLKVEALAWYSPRNIDKSGMSCNGPSPFSYTIYLTPDLSTAISASAENCLDSSALPPSGINVTPLIGFVGGNTFTATVGPDAVKLPITFTWHINGEVVRTETINSRTDSLTYLWSRPTTDQTVEVTAENSLASISSGPKTIVIIDAQTYYLPLIDQ
ncbi:MAG: hypothetical protein AB8G95_03075 [Anaerolineae bacterium]